jgi:hypothetical protein
MPRRYRRCVKTGKPVNIAQVAATNVAACLARPVKRALPVVLYLINKIYILNELFPDNKVLKYLFLLANTTSAC